MKNKIVFIGNSIVNGFPMSRGRSFPGLVRVALKEGLLPKDSGSGSGKKPVKIYADVINKGVNGETTADILRRFSHDVLDHEPAAVFIMTGTNDFIYREAEPQGCMANLEEMARMADHAGILPVFMTPLAVDAQKAEHMWMSGLGVDYDQTNRQIETFAEMIRSSGRLHIDTGAAWDSFATGEGADTYLADQLLQETLELPAKPSDAYIDGVHPTPEGYRFLAEVVLQWLRGHIEPLGLKQL